VRCQKLHLAAQDAGSAGYNGGDGAAVAADMNLAVDAAAAGGSGHGDRVGGNDEYQWEQEGGGREKAPVEFRQWALDQSLHLAIGGAADTATTDLAEDAPVAGGSGGGGWGGGYDDDDEQEGGGGAESDHAPATTAPADLTTSQLVPAPAAPAYPAASVAPVADPPPTQRLQERMAALEQYSAALQASDQLLAAAAAVLARQVALG